VRSWLLGPPWIKNHSENYAFLPAFLAA
jgi:hypothetical protein